MSYVIAGEPCFYVTHYQTQTYGEVCDDDKDR